MARNYNAPSFASPSLQSFFMDIKDCFLQMNGPYAPPDEMIAQDSDLENRLTDYSIGAGQIVAPPFPDDEKKGFFSKLFGT